MPLRDVTIRLGLNAAPFIAGVKSAQAASAGLASSMTKTAAGGSKSAAVLGSSFGTVGIAAGLAGATLVKAAADFDQAMSNVKATGADAVQNIGALRQASLDAGAATKYSATEAAGGVEALAKAGVSSADVLGGGLTGALNLAAAGNLDVAGSAEAAASAMNQFGLSGKDVPHIADLLAAGAGKAQGEVSDMAMALNQAGLIANGAGASIEETTGTLAAFASAGLVGSDAGTSFKTMLQRLQAPTAQAKAKMDALGISAYDSEGNFVGLAAVAGQLEAAFKGQSDEARSAALATIFGSDAVRAANVLYSQGESGISKWTAAVDDSGFAAEVAATKMDNLRGDIETLKGSLDTLFIQGGGGTQGPLRTVTQDLTDLTNLVVKLQGAAPEGGIMDMILGNVGRGSVFAFADAVKATLKAVEAHRIGNKTGVASSVVLSFKTQGAPNAVRDAMRVARAANLSRGEVRSVLRMLGWSPAKINAVVRALRNAETVANVRATMQQVGFNPRQINAVTDALKGAKSQSQIRARLTTAGFKPDQIKTIFQLLKDLGALPPAKPKVDAEDKATPKLSAVEKKWASLLGMADSKNFTVTTTYKTVGKPPGGFTGGRIAPGFAGGGVVPGISPSDPFEDNVLARSDGGNLLRVRSGEWIINQRASERNDRLLAAINGGFDAQGILGFAKGGKVKKRGGGGSVSPTFVSGEKAAEEARLEQDIADGVKELAAKKKGQTLTGWARRVAELELAENRAALARLRAGGSSDSSPSDAIADAKQSLIDAANAPISLFERESDSPWMSGGSFAARATQKLTQIRTLAGKLYQLRQAGLNGALLSEIYSLGSRSGIAAADELLRSPSQIGELNAAYSGIQSANSFAAAVGYAAPVTPGVNVKLEGFRVDLQNLTASAQIVVRDEVGRELQRQSFDSKVGV